MNIYLITNKECSMYPTKLALALIPIAVISGCGGGGGGGTISSNLPQLSTSVTDLSQFKNTFADTTLVDGDVTTAQSSFERLLNLFKIPQLFPSAYAQNISSCNDNVKAVAVDAAQQRKTYKKLPITEKESDKPCFTSSQEVGSYIAAQAKNLYQGSKKCDVVLIPKSGGRLHCLSVGIPTDIQENAGETEFKFSQSFAGISSLKSLGGKITDNGKYFFVAFSDDGSRTKGYDGVFRIDLTGQNPTGQLAYISQGVNPRSLSFDGYQQLENGDMIVTRADITAPVGSWRRSTYYVGVKNTFPGVAAQQIVLINSAIEFEYDGTNSPIFNWAKSNLAIGGEAITNGGSQNIAFSGSQDPNVKDFFFIIGVNRYKTFSGEYFNKLLIKGSVNGNSISFEDYGPTSLSFFGTAGISSDLGKIYWIKDWTPGQMSVVTRDVARLTSNTDRNYMPETEAAINVSLPNDYRPTLLYPTANKIFISTVKSNFYDSGSLMNLKLFVADKWSGNVYWTDRPNAFTEIPMTGYTGNNFRLDSGIPSLVSDKLNFRLTRLSDNNKFSLDADSNGIDVLDLGSRGAIPTKHAVVRGR
jgi:hypothetical protein